ncbi:MAG TPA: dienelactone hydrolase family protein [bacterium]|nr:dienelactone hydrolase family protein [bacterium]
MKERTIDIPTRDGAMPTFITHPELGGQYPAVILYMDAPGIREELRDFARRIGTVGYYCMLPNLYYRDGGPSFPPSDQRTEEESERLTRLMNGLTREKMLSDTEAMLDVIDGDPAAANGSMGCIGWCMSGPIVVWVSAHWPERFKALAALHGVRMMTDAEDSPHRLLPKLDGEQYFGFAESDHWAPLEMVAKFKEELERLGANATLEVHPGTQHGFVFPQRKIFVKAEAERNWERVFAMYRRQLG